MRGKEGERGVGGMSGVGWREGWEEAQPMHHTAGKATMSSYVAILKFDT